MTTVAAPTPRPMPADPPRRRSRRQSLATDVLVIGGGFGGLATALALAERGVRPVVCETLTYPGGCASTFEKGGYRFEAGATLFAGFEEGQLFDRWIRRHGLAVDFQSLDPTVTLRTGHFELAVPPRREELVERMAALPGAPSDRVRAFFQHQRRLADALWELFDDPDLLPPLSATTLLHHVRRLPRYLPLARWLGRPLDALVRHHGLSDFAPLRHYLDAVCQITVQTSSRDAELAFAVGAMDYYFRGTGHLRGGIGTLADAMVDAIERLGGQVRFTDRAVELEPRSGGWLARTRTADVTSRHVVANLLPQTVGQLLPTAASRPRSLGRLSTRVEEGWGAAMLYLVLEEDAAPPSPHHLQLVGDENRPFAEGNHLFCSIAALDEPERAPAGFRTATVSTHVPMRELLRRDRDGRGAYVAAIQRNMRRTLELRAPELAAGVVRDWPASPRTFERFTGRDRGFVGGIPRRAGLHNYRYLGPRRVRPGLWLVGDSVFPGQSVLSVSLGGVRLAERLLRAL